jgi:type II secretory pathway pseudopilin PulG
MTLFIISFITTFALLAAKNSRRKQRQREEIRAVEAIREAAARQKLAEAEARRTAAERKETDRQRRAEMQARINKAAATIELERFQNVTYELQKQLEALDIAILEAVDNEDFAAISKYRSQRAAIRSKLSTVTKSRAIARIKAEY